MRLYILFILAFLVILQAASAVDTSASVGISMETEDFPPRIWVCDHSTYDDNIENGETGLSLNERVHNYIFEGEQVSWTVLVLDKNGIENIRDVYATIGAVQGPGNDIEVNCMQTSDSGIENDGSGINPGCNARILEEHITQWDPSIMRYYRCTFTVESPESMYGEYYVTVEAEDLNGLTDTADENEHWFFNPVLALSITGDLDFGVVRPGAISYSETLLVGNDADEGSGVLMDMYIAGTDFYDPSSSGAKCPVTNQLSLSNFWYYAVNGAYTSKTQGGPRADFEGYLPIPYGDRISQSNRIIDGLPYSGAGHHTGNTLSPGSEMALTFKLDLPEPCNGDFSEGDIFFWGEAI